jgi:hypothetical protein
MKLQRVCAVTLIATMASCASNPQRLPVRVSLCNAVASPNGFQIIATVQNASDRPISQLELTTAFYQNFRYQRYTASAHLAQELDPGSARNITFDVAAQGRRAQGRRAQGQAMRCFVTHIGYMDGTSADAQSEY